MTKLFDPQGNLAGKGELRYTVKDLQSGQTAHTLVSGNVELTFVIYKNGKFREGVLMDTYISKEEYPLLKAMVGIVEEGR